MSPYFLTPGLKYWIRYKFIFLLISCVCPCVRVHSCVRVMLKHKYSFINSDFHFSACAIGKQKCTVMDSGNNANVLHGALVGGTDLDDNYLDQRHNTIYTSVALDYNAGFQGALAGKKFL